MTKDEKIEDLKKNFTETEEIIFKRRSTRLYKKEQVPEFMIKRILEAGRFAPSAGNAQPWKFVVIRDQSIIDDITKTVVRLCKIFSAILDYRRKYFFWLRPLSKLSVRFQHNDLHPVPFGALPLIAKGKLGLWHGAPTVILIFKDVRGVGSPELDCGIAGASIDLAAHSMGLGTCWVSFSKMAFKYSLKWKRKLGIKYPYKFVTSFSIGWGKGDADGMIERETHAIDWYEDSEKKIIY
jgi:nitroreductase